MKDTFFEDTKLPKRCLANLNFRRGCGVATFLNIPELRKKLQEETFLLTAQCESTPGIAVGRAAKRLYPASKEGNWFLIKYRQKEEKGRGQKLRN